MLIQDQEKIHRMALSNVKGVGCVLFRKLLQHFGEAHAIFQRTPSDLCKAGCSRPVAHAILKKDTLLAAEAAWQAHQKAHIQILSLGETGYPERLTHLHDAPALLYFTGNTPLNPPRVVSIVGTRQATAYGKKVVENFVKALVPYAVLIVSGLAYGIDIYAHYEALQSGLPTLAVLAGGLDRIYPARHQKILQAMLQHGGALSEYPLQTKPEAHQFPARNRIIAGMADATLVIEANRKSGALITAQLANDYNREVFAVPGGVDAPYSSGCNYLIQNQQAHLITQAEEVALLMNWTCSPTAPSSPGVRAIEPERSEPARQVVQALARGAVHIDALSGQTKLSMQQLSATLLHLELQGKVQALPGKKFRLLPPAGAALVCDS